MTLGNSTTPVCGHCGRPVLGPAVWSGAVPYHAECTMPPQTPRYAPMPAWPGCEPLVPMTEQRVREIVREELAKHNAGLNRPGSRSEAEAGGSELKPLLGEEGVE
jgi:hypothetical protein